MRSGAIIRHTSVRDFHCIDGFVAGRLRYVGKGCKEALGWQS
jgi:hypothetical protein